MSRHLRLAVVGLWIAARAVAAAELELGPAALERLGVELALPAPAIDIEIAAGVAEVVIPPARQAIVATTVSGALSRVHVVEGERVAEGQLLAELASPELLGLQREYVDAAAAAELADAQLRRDEGLLAGGIVAERRLHESRMAAQVARARVDQLRQQLGLAGMTAAEIARLAETRALGPTVGLRAPIGGVVVEQMSALGAHVDELEPVYRIADPSVLWLEARVPQERAGRVAPGMRVVAHADGGAASADVTLVASVVDAATQTVLVRAVVDTGAARLRPGQFLPVRILGAAGTETATVAVPSAAIVRIDEGAYVFAAGDDGAGIDAVPVTILGEDGATTYVGAELAPDRAVAVRGVAALKSAWLAAREEGE